MQDWSTRETLFPSFFPSTEPPEVEDIRGDRHGRYAVLSYLVNAATRVHRCSNEADHLIPVSSRMAKDWGSVTWRTDWKNATPSIRKRAAVYPRRSGRFSTRRSRMHGRRRDRHGETRLARRLRQLGKVMRLNRPDIMILTLLFRYTHGPVLEVLRRLLHDDLHPEETSTAGVPGSPRCSAFRSTPCTAACRPTRRSLLRGS